MKNTFRILVINPGSTSTKIALFENNHCEFSESISHSKDELKTFKHISEQHSFRTQLIEEFLQQHKITLSSLHAVVGRGGLLRPIPSGTYRVNDVMLDELNQAERGEHASNLGAIISFDIASKVDIPAFIVDPVVVDEFDDIARYTGIKELKRRSILHALNQKAVARKASQELGKKYEELNFIVAHMGGGITVGSHLKGRIVDVNDGLSGEGPFTPERSGGLPTSTFMELCYSGRYTRDEMKKKLIGQGGMIAYLGTSDMSSVEKRVEKGDKVAEKYYQAMAYQVAKEIGLSATVLKGKVDGIILTGGLAYDKIFISLIKERVSWISRIFIYPGEKEMEALASGALRVLQGEEEHKEYQKF
ncbi:MAG: butyrate kinase [bacterium]